MRGVISIWLTVVACVSSSGAPDPVAFYPLRRPFNTSDTSCHGNSVAVAKGVRLVDSGFGGPADTSYEFVGTRQSYIHIKKLHPSVEKDRYSFTFLVWINHTGTSGPIISYISDDFKLGCGLWMTLPGKLTARCMGQFNGHSKVSLSSNKEKLQASWHYVGMSYNHDLGRLTLWINGKAVKSKSFRSLISTQDSMCMGACKGDRRYFRGQMSCLQIFSKSLSNHEVAVAGKRCNPDQSSEMLDCGSLSASVSASHNCGSHMTNLSGTFMSPGYPTGYHSALECQWTIEVPRDYYLRIRLTFNEFDVPETLNGCENHVVIYDGPSTWSDKLKQYCQPYDGWHEWLNASENNLKVDFRCGAHGTGGGFFAQYQAVSIVEDAGMDFSEHYTGVVIGVACAALFTVLAIITFNQARRSLRCHQSLRQLVPQSDEEICGQTDAPPSYRQVVERPELYPPTPVLNRSRMGTPAGSPAQSPCNSPAIARRSRTSLASQNLVPRIGTPVGIFSPRHASPSPSRPTSCASQTISPLVRNVLMSQISTVSQGSYHAGVPTDDDDEDPPPYSADLLSLSQCSVPAEEDPPPYSAVAEPGLVDHVTLAPIRASSDQLQRVQTSSLDSRPTIGYGFPRVQTSSRESIPTNDDGFPRVQTSSRDSLPANGDGFSRRTSSRESIPTNDDGFPRVQTNSRESIPTNDDGFPRVQTTSRESIPTNGRGFPRVSTDSRDYLRTHVNGRTGVQTSSRESIPANGNEFQQVRASSRESVPTNINASRLASQRSDGAGGTPSVSRDIVQEREARTDAQSAPVADGGVQDSVWRLRSDARQKRTNASAEDVRNSAANIPNVSGRGAGTRSRNFDSPSNPRAAAAGKSPWTLRQGEQRSRESRSHAARAHPRNETMTPTCVTSTGGLEGGAVVRPSTHPGSNLGKRNSAAAAPASSVLRGEESIV